MNHRTLVFAVCSCTVLVAGCSGSPSAQPPTNSIRGAHPGDATLAVFGKSSPIGDLKLTLTDPTVGGDKKGPWLTLTVDAVNPTDGAQLSPQFEIDCAGNTTGGTQFDSTYFQSVPLPAGSSRGGTVNLLLPGDDRAHPPRPSCATPAVVTATGAAGVRLTWAIADDVVAAMNLAPQPAAIGVPTTILNAPHPTGVPGAEL